MMFATVRSIEASERDLARVEAAYLRLFARTGDERYAERAAEARDYRAYLDARLRAHTHGRNWVMRVLDTGLADAPVQVDTPAERRGR